MTDTIIRAEALGKRYRLRHQNTTRYLALRDVLTDKARRGLRRLSGNLERRSAASHSEIEDFWALRNVSFEVRQGDVIGIIGRNGAGKSTLLKILSRITEPSEGRVHIRGRVASLLEVGTGFHPELTGRENIFLNGAILGMRRKEIAEKFDEIVAFAEVEKFLDTPIKHYSSGMYVRLAFAVAAHLDPEILMIDEVLSVGDAAFQRKCLGQMNQLAAGGRTVFFVSHNLNLVERICTRALVLESGRVAGAYDDPHLAVTEYLRVESATSPTIWRSNNSQSASSRFKPRLLSITSLQPDAERGGVFSNTYPLQIRLEFEVVDPDPALNVGIAIYDDSGTMLFWSFIKDGPEHEWPAVDSGRTEMVVELPPRWLNEGVYRVEFLAGLHCREWFLQPGGSVPSVGFEIKGGLSDSPLWHFRRPGLLGPVLNWRQRPHDGDSLE